MNNANKAQWLLRIGVAGEFIGHGLLGIGKKADWIKWIVQLIHVSTSTATTMIVVIGCLDLVVAVWILIKPVKPILLWAAFWGFWTALVRPLVGVGWLDFIERWANWAAPLALYFLMKDNQK